MKIIVFANSFFNVGGGEKIFVEYAKRWDTSGENIEVVTNEKGKQFCLEHGLKERNITVWSSSWSDRLGIFFSSAYKSFISIFRGLFLPASAIDVVFSASFIWPDLFPGLILKLRYPHIRWVVASYLFVIPPWAKYYNGNPLRTLTLYSVQLMALFFMKYFSDGVFVASPFDESKFSTRNKTNHPQVIPVRGGVNFDFFDKAPKEKLLYDAIFVGRFHPQKNVDELIDIWKKVVKKLPESKLALIGEGYMEDVLREKVQTEKLENNISFLGFADGVKKTKILKSSKIFLSASRFDTGNIALDEALACGLPGIVYDLPHLFYPAGVVKIPIGDKSMFVEAILELLQNEKKYKDMSHKGTQFASTLDWDITAKKALLFMKELH